MEQTPTESRPAVKYDVIVQDDGHILLRVPFSPGKRVTVFVVEEHITEDPFHDLIHASQTSTDFWDNPYDDEDWNDA
jgi:hypothetical protein